MPSAVSFKCCDLILPFTHNAFIRVFLNTRASHRPPSLEDKRQFRGNMYKINSDQLGEIVQTLEQQCPEAIAKVRWSCKKRSLMHVTWTGEKKSMHEALGALFCLILP